MKRKNEDKTLLVCGGAGFIGSHFVRHILHARPEVRVVNFDKLTYCGNLGNLNDVRVSPRYQFVKGDIADRRALERIFKKYHPHYVVNFAAETHVDRSIHAGAGDFVRTNIDGVYALLETMRMYRDVKKYVQVSTDEVYGDLPLGSRAKFTEASPVRPSSPYAATKAAGDLLCLAYWRTFGIPVVVTRSGNNFGSHQYPEKLIPFFVHRLMVGQTLPLYGDGKHVRDWIHVEDHCLALEAVLFHGKEGEIFNIGAGAEKSNREIARHILGEFGADESRLELVADRPGHDRRYALDTAKITRTLGWRSTCAFEKGIRETVRWYRKNTRWIALVMQKSGAVNTHIA